MHRLLRLFLFPWLPALSGLGVGRAADTFAPVGPAFLQKHCVSCHGPEKQKGGLRLDGFTTEVSLLQHRKQWKGILEAVEQREMPPDDEPQPAAADSKAFLQSARAVFSSYDRNAAPDPGRLTVRRLNRLEYNQTIRDLIGLDLQPASDFPSDDVGFGFDNIGDVLSLSPVLMERYLDAAQAVAEQAIPATIGKPNIRTMAARYCEPGAPQTPSRGNWRIFTTAGTHVETGPINTPFKLELAGEHLFRARVYAESPSGRPVKVALLVSGSELENPEAPAKMAELVVDQVPQVKRSRIVQIAEVTARDEAHAQVIEGRVPPTRGIERVAVALVRDAGANPPPHLYVEWLQVEGPLDTRGPFLRQWAGGAADRPAPQRTREMLAQFLPRAWRRPVTGEELERVAALADAAQARGESWEGGLRQALIAILSSPKFIFRLEPDTQPEATGAHPVTEHQLATRLSYFLWSTCPDQELVALADRGQLAANLEAQVRRMLRDPKAEALTSSFALQWLQLRRLSGHQADESVFKRWRSALKRSMLTETELFFAEIVREDRSVLDFLDGDFTYLDRRLGELYGITPPGGYQGDAFRRVSLAGTARGGLLTHASVLTVTSNPTRTSPVKRGKWILEQLLGDPPPPPPPNVGSIDDQSRKELKGTFRQRLEQHRADPQCANCHAKMDTMGFALENFNGIGQWRDRNEEGKPVEVGGKAGGIDLRSLADLKQLLRGQKDQFTRCLTEKMLIYALGRGLEYYDERTVDRIQTALAKNNYRFSALVIAIVQSDPFRLRRGSGQGDQ